MRIKRAVAAVAAVMVVALSSTPAFAATNFPIGPLNVSPTTGVAGSSFTASQDVDPRRFCPTWSVTFAGVPEGADGNSSAPTRSVSGQVPLNISPGSYDVLSFCGDPSTGGQQQVGAAKFLVIAPSTTTTSTTTTTTTIATTTTAPPTTTTTTVKPTTTTAKATTTTAKATTTTAKPTTTTTIATTTTTPTTTTTSTTLPPTTTTTTTTKAPAEVLALTLDKTSVTPGGDVTATGEGCDPGANVTLEIEGKQVAQTTAKSDGTFSAPIEVPDVDPGRLQVEAHCGPVITTQLDVVLASTVSNNSSMLVLAFFVIVLAALLWYGWQARRGL